MLTVDCFLGMLSISGLTSFSVVEGGTGGGNGSGKPQEYLHTYLAVSVPTYRFELRFFPPPKPLTGILERNERKSPN